jgi:hypothetical protein
VYVDQLEGGVVVVLTTGDADALAAELHEAEPRLAEDLRVRHVDATAAQLEEAAARLFGERDEWSGGIPVFEAGVDYERTQVVIAVPSDQVQTAAAVAGTALAYVLDSIDAQDTGITIRVKEGRQPAPTVCTSRSNCYNPLRPGVKITSNSLCTLGFHIIFNGSARNTLTAGHCSGTVWYHYSFGLVGVQSANLLCAGGAPYSDIKRMTIDPSQQTTAVYGQTASEAVFVNASTWPVQNATARMSLGNTNALRTGIVVAALLYYTLIGTPCDILGGAYNITSIGGDSGSPSWHPSPNRAIGINSSEDGHVGLVQRALGVWNAKVYG